MEKEKTKHTIVLKSKNDREKTLKALIERGGKVVHDSGERVLIVEVPKGTKLRQKLPATSKLLLLNSNVIKEISRPSEHERLFIDALKLRTSKAFIEEKKLRIPGSTPEEQEMMLESDFIEGDIDKI